MKSFLTIFAYLCIWATPLQLFFITWGLVVVFNTELTILSLSNEIFLSENLPWLYSLVKSIWYFVLPDVFASWLLALPFTMHVLAKGIFSTWLGVWLLPIAKKMS
ncbi:MAG: hypothetical protein CMQ19_12760 [Gammaproteobacteria bacterium]|nr:hypothetical protein [Gammaproteobacteria bacterium]